MDISKRPYMVSIEWIRPFPHLKDIQGELEFFGEGGMRVFDSNKDNIIRIYKKISSNLLKDGFIITRKIYDKKDNTFLETYVPKSRKTPYKNYDEINIIFANKKFYSNYILVISVRWENFAYIKSLAEEIHKNETHPPIYLGAKAPPDYNENPLYYPLIAIIYHPDGTIEDNTAYCTEPPEPKYKDYYGLKEEVLKRRWEEWDREKPGFDPEPGEFSPQFPSRGIASYVSTSRRYFIDFTVEWEGKRNLEKISNIVLSKLTSDGFNIEVEEYDRVKLSQNKITAEGGDGWISIWLSSLKNKAKEMYNVEDGLLYFRCGESYEEKYKKVTGYLSIRLEWCGRMLPYIKDELVPITLKNCEYDKARLCGWGPSIRKEKPPLYPLIDILWDKDGKMIDCTVYDEVERKRDAEGTWLEQRYYRLKGFDPDILPKKYVRTMITLYKVKKFNLHDI